MARQGQGDGRRNAMPASVNEKQLRQTAAVALITILSIFPKESIANQSLDKERVRKARALILMDSSNWEEAMQYWTDDIVYQDPAIVVEGIDAAGEFLKNLFDVMPIYSLTIHHEAYSGNTYMAEWTMQGIWLGYHFVHQACQSSSFATESLTATIRKTCIQKQTSGKNIP